MIDNMGKAKLIARNKPGYDAKGAGIGQLGRDYMLEIDGKVVPGVISKTINMDPNELVTLTIVMKLPAIEYKEC